MSKLLVLFLLTLISFSANSITWDNDNFKISADGYIGYRFVGATVAHSAVPSNPELGLALSAQYGNHVTLYTQFAYDEDIESALVYSFAAYDLQFDNDIKLTLKGGKLRHNYGLYNAYRVNPRTRPGVIVPQAIYWDSLSHILTSGVGVGFDLTWKNLELGYTIDEPASVDGKEEALVWSRGLLEEVEVSFGSHQTAYLQYTFEDIPLKFKSAWAQLNLGNKSTALSNFIFPS